MLYVYTYQRKATPAKALSDIIRWMNDGNPAAPGTGPGFLAVQVYDPNAIDPYEAPTDGDLANLAADNCFHPDNVADGITTGAWIVYQAVDATHPAQFGIAFTSATNIRFVPGGDMNKAGALGGFDVSVENPDITNSASWRDGKMTTVDFAANTTVNARWFAQATESAFALVFDDLSEPRMRMYVMGKMTGTTTGDNYPVVQFMACDRVWGSSSDGVFWSSSWQRFSKVDNTTLVLMYVKNVCSYSGWDGVSQNNMKDSESNEWPVLSLELHCPSGGHMGQWGVAQLICVSGSGVNNGASRGNIKKNGVANGYVYFKNSTSTGQNVIVFENDTTDVTAV